MDIEQLKKDYEIYRPFYEDFQKEVLKFIQDIHSRTPKVDIAKISERPNGKIKELESILDNLRERPLKYKNVESLVGINDIAGVRITCHCQSDRDIFFNILNGELKRKYTDVIGDSKEGIYRAYHYNFAKTYNVGGEEKNLYCELQLRTVLGDAWAVQDGKYVYKNKKSEGEPQLLSEVISNILNGCESLWSMVKEKSIESEEKGLSMDIPEIVEIQRQTEQNLDIAHQGIIRTRQTLQPWFDKHKQKAHNGLKELGIDGFMQVEMYLSSSEVREGIVKQELLEITKSSQIQTFGWPIGIYLDRDEYRPKPDKDGIVAEVSLKPVSSDGSFESSYDYWSLNMDGSFYLLHNLFEDRRRPNYIFFDTRIVRITEVLLYAKNLYSKLGIGPNDPIIIKIKHGGLNGRIIGSSGNRYLSYQRKSIEDDIEAEVITTLREIEDHTTDVVGKFTTPLFEIFEFFSVEKHIIQDIVEKYKNGVVS